MIARATTIRTATIVMPAATPVISVSDFDVTDVPLPGVVVGELVVKVRLGLPVIKLDNAEAVVKRTVLV